MPRSTQQPCSKQNFFTGKSIRIELATKLISAIYSKPIEQQSAIMGDHDSPGTCLSTVPHGPPFRQDVRDVLLHYFGCLRGDGKRDENKNLLPTRKLNEAETATEVKRLCEEYQRQAFYNSLPLYKQQRIDEEKRRIGDLRALFENDDNNRGLVKRFRTSLNAWLRRPLETERGTLPDEKKLCKENAFGLSGYMMFFENKEGGTTSGYTGVKDEAFPEKFPNQKIPLKELLYNTDPGTNPLMKPCKDGMIRYFHLPGNNMEWIEVRLQGSLCSTLSSNFNT
jgi:hypothetical protein